MRTLAPRAQRGATLMVAIIFLSVLMVAVAVAFRMSNINLKAVGNMQGQVEAEAAANKAIESAISTAATFTTPAASAVPADEHGVTVSIAQPQCIRSTPVYVPNSGGYFNGDFDYNGKINGDDYFIIDSNLNAQAFPPAGGDGGIAGVTSVPEPGAIGTIVIGAGAALLRRRRTGT